MKEAELYQDQDFKVTTNKLGYAIFNAEYEVTVQHGHFVQIFTKVEDKRRCVFVMPHLSLDLFLDFDGKNILSSSRKKFTKAISEFLRLKV